MRRTRLYTFLTSIIILILLLAVLPISASAASKGLITAPANHVDEGATLQLSTNMSGVVTWTSSNTSVATVSSSGRVTGKLAGQVTITATCNGYTTANYTIYVTVPDGLYYFKNASSSLCMQTTADTTYVYTQDTSNDGRIPQLWKVTHISNGNYVIRPIRDLSVALTVNASGYLAVADAPANDSSVPASMYWRINKNGFGYALKLNGYDSQTAMPTTNGVPGVPVHPSNWTSSLTCHWNMVKTGGVFIRNVDTLETTTTSTSKTISHSNTFSLSELGFAIDTYGSMSNLQWSSTNTNVATINLSGDITTKIQGTTIITATATINGINYISKYTCNVGPNNAILLAFNDGVYNRSEFFTAATEKLETLVNSRSTNVTTNYFTSCIPNQIYYYLQNHDYFIIHTHGAQDRISINGSNAFVTMQNIEPLDLSNLDLIILLTCNTAENYDPTHITNNSPVNITEQLVICGAETVIGFRDSTHYEDCNNFAEQFTTLVFENGYSVNYALSRISTLGFNDPLMISNNCVVAGNIDNDYR